MEPHQPYLIFGVFVAVLAVLSAYFHGWLGSSPAARRRRSPLWLGFGTTFTSLLFLITGLLGLDISKRTWFRSALHQAIAALEEFSPLESA